MSSTLLDDDIALLTSADLIRCISHDYPACHMIILLVRCMSHDYPALSSACEQAEDAKSCFDMESMKHSVELFNATMMFVNPSNGLCDAASFLCSSDS